MATIALNVSNFVTLRLNNTNYPLWREQILALAESQDLVEHLTDAPPPTEIITEIAPGSNKTEPNPTYIQWRKSDRLLRGWIIGTLSEEALGLVVGLDSAHHVWVALKEAYAHDSQEREFHLTQQITYLRKDPSASLGDHLRTFKGLCDSLASIGRPVQDKMKVFSLLNSLGSKYETFTTAMLKPPMPSYTELIPLLQGFELRSTLHEPTHTFAFYGQRGSNQASDHHRSPQPTNRNNYRPPSRGFSSKGRGFHPSNQSVRGYNGDGNQNARFDENQNVRFAQNTRGPNSLDNRSTADRPTADGRFAQNTHGPNSSDNRPTTKNHDPTRTENCQICGKRGHVALKCWNRFNHSYQPEDIPQALAAMSLEDFSHDAEWTADTGASAHMTGDPVVKEREIEIGYPTDVKHVAHVGLGGQSGSAPSWMNEYKTASEFSTTSLGSLGEFRDSNSMPLSTWSSHDFEHSMKHRPACDTFKDIPPTELHKVQKKQKRKKSRSTSSPKSSLSRSS